MVKSILILSKMEEGIFPVEEVYNDYKALDFRPGDLVIHSHIGSDFHGKLEQAKKEGGIGFKFEGKTVEQLHSSLSDSDISGIQFEQNVVVREV